MVGARGKIVKMADRYKGTRRTEYPTYMSWISMKRRCYYARENSYERYGGRGITVCDRWLSSFENFLEDMGPRQPGTTLDRIDSEGHYEPNNCRWATNSQQRRNLRKNVLVVYRGQTKLLMEWADVLKVPYQTLYARVQRLPVEQALDTNLIIRRRKK